jgi:glycosyltransferase involved in cell wall biosynthesis
MSSSDPTPAARSVRTSVLINNYNNGSFLRRCVESVLQQSQKSDEIVIVDDGSTDESREILSEFEHCATIVRLSHGTGSPLENQARVIYSGFKACTGDLIFLLDGDDTFLPEKIANYCRAFTASPDVVMIQAPLQKIDETDRVIGYEFERPRHQDDYLSHIYSAHELNIYYPTSSLAFARSYLEQHLPLDFSDNRHIWPDARLALIAPHFGKVVCLSRPYTQWRRHSKSHTVLKAFSVYQLVRENQAYFNEFCRRTGRPTISPWKSIHHRRRWFRHHFVPDRLIHWYRILRWWTLDEATRRRMLDGPDPIEIARELDRFERLKLAPCDAERGGSH